MKYKFRRYKIRHKGKDYYILIPQKYEKLWVLDWADDWYEGAFIDGSEECIQSLNNCAMWLATCDGGEGFTANKDDSDLM